MSIKELFKKKHVEENVKTINQRLLDYLSESLILMAKLKLPYFHLEGIGGIYMDETYAERNKIDLSNDDKEIVFKIKRNLNKNLSDEIVEQFKNLIDVKISDCLKEVKGYLANNNIENELKETNKDDKESSNDVYEQVEKALSGSETKEDSAIPDVQEAEINTIDDNGEIKGINPSKEEAVDTVRHGKRYFSPEQQRIIRKNYAIRNNKKEPTNNQEDY